MGLADREYMRKDYKVDRKSRKKYRDTYENRKIPSYRVYKFRRFVLEIKDKLRGIFRKQGYKK